MLSYAMPLRISLNYFIVCDMCNMAIQKIFTFEGYEQARAAAAGVFDEGFRGACFARFQRVGAR